jgi:molecular chaperone DnaK (HSP70)
MAKKKDAGKRAAESVAAPPVAARFVVGIDLGTTNTVVAFVDPSAKEGRVTPFPLVQTVDPGDARALPLLPSSIYLPAGPELPEGALALPWEPRPARAVGAFARDQGANVPARLVSSAKSWLCHAGVDRRGPILPFDAPADVPKISPVEAQAAILRHVAAAWDHAHADMGEAGALAAQDVYLCVPASFDAAARELTLEAARAAGLAHVTLLEEPLAAFYAWLHGKGDAWREVLKKGDVALVVDVGGGTTDFSLIHVAEEDGNLLLERIAVGDHLLLGGDNMDLALAHVVSWRLEGVELDPWQSRALWHACRAAKESLFADPAKAEATVAVAGRGTRLVGGLVKASLTRDDLQTIGVDGFFPLCDADDRPAKKARKTGLAEIGLPFVADPAVTKHLAAFLARHARPEDEGFVKPKYVLFNGGVMRAEVLRARTVETIAEWTGDPVTDLGGTDLDLAVAHGAAYYGLVKRGKGIRIRGGAARSYYVGIESSLPAVPGMAPPVKPLCVCPFGMEEGTEVSIEDREFGLLTGETAEFRFFGSSSRKEDRPGDLLPSVPEGMQELSSIETHLEVEPGRPQETIPVTIRARLTEVGTLDLFCVRRDGKGAWKLRYDVRSEDE